MNGQGGVARTEGATPDDECIDIHHHVGSLVLGDHDDPTAGSVEADMEKRLRLMDRYGITAAAILPSLQFERSHGERDVIKANDAAAAYRDANPSRFPAAIGTVDPLTGSAACEKEIYRAIQELGMVGLTWHNRFQGLFLGDARMEPLIAQASDLGVPVYIHLFAESTMEAPWGLEKWAERFPEQTFVALDAFTSHTQAKYLMAIGRRCPNIIFETAGTFTLGRIVQEFVAEFGAERVVFGSDLYVNPQTWDTPSTLLEIRAAESIYPAARAQILAGNARRLLKLDSRD
jgi:predicted TIM-barrel fold metal-dependent hydrolase